MCLPSPYSIALLSRLACVKPKSYAVVSSANSLIMIAASQCLLTRASIMQRSSAYSLRALDNLVQTLAITTTAEMLMSVQLIRKRSGPRVSSG